MIFALDTNIISYLLKDNPVVYGNFDRATRSGGSCIVPPVAYYEIKRGLLAVNATEKAHDFDRLCTAIGVGDMTIRAWDEAAVLHARHRRSGTLLEDADFFVAAFCIVNRYTLVTNNTKHFERIDGLRFEDWTI